MSPKFVYNGKEYSSLEELPPELRQVYEQALSSLADRDQNGIPDILEGTAAHALVTALNAFHVNGQMYGNLDELPPEVRQAYQKAMAMLSQWTDQNQNGVPDMLEQMQAAQGQNPAAMQAQFWTASQAQSPVLAQAQPQPIAPAAPQAVQQPSAISGDIESSERNLRLLFIGGAIVLLLLLAVGLAAVLLFGGTLLPR
jgi:hypothetical protein